MLDKVFYGNTLENWGISLIIIFSSLILNKLISLLNKKFIFKWVQKTRTKFDDIFFSSLESPVLCGILLLAIWIAAMRLDLGTKMHDIIAKSYQILVVLNITWFLARFADGLLDDYGDNVSKKQKVGKAHIDKKLKPMIKRMVAMFIWAIGIIMALNNAGVSVGALLGTLGIGGIAVALAAQDTVKNIIGGLTIFSDQPFRIGDRIQFDAIDGTVEDIGVRSTKIRTLDKRLLTIPNYKVVDAAIVNVSGEPRRRVVAKLSMRYDTTPDQMKKAMEILKEMPEHLKDIDAKDLSATFSNFADSSLTINYIYFIKKSSKDAMETTSQVNLEILTRFNEVGLGFAFPTQTIYIEKEA